MSKFTGSPFNVSPLCQACFRIQFASEKGFDNYQCDECKKAYESAVKVCEQIERMEQMKQKKERGRKYSEDIRDELVEKMVEFLEQHQIFELMDLVTAAIATKEQE